MTTEELIALALESGFDAAAPLDVRCLQSLPEIREMCAANRCRSYNLRWSCPPAVGTPEELQKKLRSFQYALLTQTFGQREDPFDYPSIQAAETRHRENFERMAERLHMVFPSLMSMGVGPCQRCRDCSWPDAPCRFPEKLSPPMEAFGLSVSELCRAAGLSYYRGPAGICFTSCFLYNK
ncbi:MAG: DUF2284 domain-containing protein [Eubacteriales bacterium]|nr:DUF2284 domain-containing protein [Eubacteriales bacterium]